VDEPSLPEESIFGQALEVRADERAAFLDQACGDNQALRAAVEALLRANERSGDLLDLPESPPATVDEPSALERPGATIGSYKLLEPLGEGGFGAVFLAEQAHPVRRKVALKVLKPGMDSRQVVARFEAERQALALMDHAHIAKVFDGGTTASGRPYFVMELVKGVPITDFCDQNHLTPRQRLELFILVCLAVQHAHQKGIIHRDIKPSNVLVSRHDTAPVVKVIDFGVAKALGQELTDRTLFTGAAQMIGTPLYMAPEQAGLSNLDVDTRSDVYSLGVLLYELLTGTTPFEKERFRKVGYDEMRRIIREEEPPRPSARINTLGQEALTVSTRRQSDPRRLKQLFQGELDWIVMKALEKDRNRRYGTASAFAADVQHHLNDEPVQACPPSSAYRFRKFARRNRTGLVLVGLVLTFVVLSGGGVGWTARDRAAQRAIFKAEIDQALQETARAYQLDKLPEAWAELKRAEGLLASAEVGEEFLQRTRGWRTGLKMAARLEEVRLEHTAVKDGHFDWEVADAAYREAFGQYGLDLVVLAPEEAADRIRQSPIRDALVAALDDWAALTWVGKGDRAAAERLLAVAGSADDDAWRNQFRSAFRRDDRRTLKALAQGKEVPTQPPATVGLVANVLRRTGELALAVEVLRRAQPHHPADFWINHELAYYLLQVRPPLGHDAISFYRVAVVLRPESPGVRVNFGVALQSLSRLPEAEHEYRTATRLKPDYADAHANLGVVLRMQSKLPAAETAYSEAVRLDPKSFRYQFGLGRVRSDQNKLAGAQQAFREAIGLNPDSSDAHWALANVFYLQRKYAEAEAEYRQVVHRQGGNATARYHLAGSQVLQRKWAEAFASYEEAIHLDPNLLLAHTHLAWYLSICPQLELREPRRALAAAMKAVELAPSTGGPRLSTAYQVLGWAYYRTGDWKAGIEALEKSVALQDKPAGGDPYQWYFLAMAHWRLGHKDAARKWYAQATRYQEEHAPGDEGMRSFQAEAAVLMEIPGLARGRFHAERGDWGRAAPDYAKAFEAEPDSDPFVRFEHAYLLVQAGDLDGYRRLCGRMRDQLGRKATGDDVIMLAHTCVLAPDALGDGAEVMRLAEQRLALTCPDPWSTHVMGLACYRAGQHEKAIAWLNQSMKDHPNWEHNVLNGLVLAMAHHRLGETAGARQRLATVGQGIAEIARKKSEKAVTFAPPGWHWRDWLGVQLLRREAEGLLQKDPGSRH
jgi:serine/threonine-protein kinase